MNTRALALVTGAAGSLLAAALLGMTSSSAGPPREVAPIDLPVATGSPTLVPTPTTPPGAPVAVDAAVVRPSEPLPRESVGPTTPTAGSAAGAGSNAPLEPVVLTVPRAPARPRSRPLSRPLPLR